MKSPRKAPAPRPLASASPASEAPANPYYRDPASTALPRRHFLGVLGAASVWALAGAAAEETKPVEGKGKGGGKGGKGGGGKGGKGGGGGDFVVPADLSEYNELNVVLGRATDKAITVSLLAKVASEAYLEFGPAPGKYARKTAVAALVAGQPTELVLDELKPNTEYFYRLQSRKPGGTFAARPECRFATQRAPGSTFSFTLQGDSHPERMGKVSHPELYARTLQLAAASKPDFHICIGDDFSVDHVRTVSNEALAAPYLLQRPFLGLIGQTAPVFLMNGNHEQASLYNYSQKDVRREVAVGVQLARNKFYPTPSAGTFYSGDPTPWKDIGELKSYTAWTWGDALFVILDNYWHSPALVDTGYAGEDANAKPGAGGGKGDKGHDRDWWNISLGDAQYKWFKKTLETSKAKHKFVFAHHVMGTGRGGVDQADLYEWGGQGGRGGKGEGSFMQKRPGWDAPVHALMVKHKVSVFFQGHDHLYCKQEKDGVVYQELPMPSDYTYEALNEERYAGGTKLGNSGYVNVTVSPTEVKVEYVRTYLAKDVTADRKSGAVAHTYTVKAKA